jgi:hypothetical protein
LNPLSPTRTAPSRPPPTEIISITNNRWGGVVGVGAEGAVGGGWTLKSEALYMHFTQQQGRLVSPPFAPGVPVFTNTDNAVVARVGFNFEHLLLGFTAARPDRAGATSPHRTR